MFLKSFHSLRADVITVSTSHLAKVFGFMANEHTGSVIAALVRRLNEAEKNIRLLKVDVIKFQTEIDKLGLEENTDDAPTKSVRKPSVKKRSYADNSEDKVDKKSRFDFDEENGYTVVFTDGACTNNGKAGAKAGIGVWWGDNHPLNVSKPCLTRQTNNAAEIQACSEACRIAASNGVDKLLIKTDSDFVIKCMNEWIKRWKRTNWKTAAGKPVINKEDLVELEKQSNFLKEVKYEHVSGHSGIRGNEEADRLAVRGAGMLH